MIYLRYDEESKPAYMTAMSAGADLRAREECVILPGKVVAVPTGVWIDMNRTCFESQTNEIFELQIRARSGLAFKNQITLANGVGTIDADYPDEIKILLINHGDSEFKVEKGMRIGQLVLSKVHRLPNISAQGKRVGGFGSTGIDKIKQQV